MISLIKPRIEIVQEALGISQNDVKLKLPHLFEEQIAIDNMYDNIFLLAVNLTMVYVVWSLTRK